MGTLDNRARSYHVQDATPALLPVRMDPENTQVGKAANPDNLPRRNLFLFPATVPTIIRPEHQPKQSVVLMSQPLHFNEKESEVSFTTKPTYNVLHTYGVTVKTMRTAAS